MVLPGPSKRAALDVVAGDSGDHLGLPVHRRRSHPPQAALQRTRRIVARLRQFLAGSGRASDLAAAQRVLVVSAAVHDLDPRLLHASGLAARSDVRGVSRRAGPQRTLPVRALWIPVLPQSTRRATRPRAAARRAARAPRQPGR